MNPEYDVISDFLDGEPFDPHALGNALAEPAGRDLLIDFVILRYAAQADDAVPVPAQVATRRRGHFLWAAAAALIALVAGYQLGDRQVSPDPTRPPAITRVVTVEWQNVPEEGAK